MKEAIEANDFGLYYERNLAFHNAFLRPCGNDSLVTIVNNLKKRLYDFPRLKGFVKEWEEASIGEHQQLIDIIRSGKKQEAANHMRDVHWSFGVQKKYIRKYYTDIVKDED
jgi:DNA-binding GntR family transcriptional regulator